jgi:hypothetical protein
VYIVKEPALKGLTSHPCKYSILVVRDEILVFLYQAWYAVTVLEDLKLAEIR